MTASDASTICAALASVAPGCVAVGPRSVALVGDCLETLARMLAKSVHTIITSPPYLDARDYGVPPTSWPEVTYRPRFDLEPVTVPAMTCCLGHETTLIAYVGHLVLIARELARVLRDDGTFWLNIAAGYSSGTTAPRKPTTTEGDHVPASWKGRCYEARVTAGLAAKQRIPVPSAVCDALQADGWYVRADIVWSKSNAKPDSAMDRPTPAHEHLYLFTRKPRYFFDALAISTPAKGGSRNRARKYGDARGDAGDHHGASIPWSGDMAHPRDVWTINVGRFKGAHFATMPVELARRAAKAGTSSVGCCPTCGTPWWPVVAQVAEVSTRGGRRKHADLYERQGATGALATGVHHTRGLVAWERRCKCPHLRPVPCTVLDPFGGAGTTALAGEELELHTVLCELSEEFVEMQQGRRREGRRDLRRGARVRLAPPAGPRTAPRSGRSSGRSTSAGAGARDPGRGRVLRGSRRAR